MRAYVKPLGVDQTTEQSFDFNGESDLDLEYAMALTNPQPITLLQTGDTVEGQTVPSILRILRLELTIACRSVLRQLARCCRRVFLYFRRSVPMTTAPFTSILLVLSQVVTTLISMVSTPIQTGEDLKVINNWALKESTPYIFLAGAESCGILTPPNVRTSFIHTRLLLCKVPICSSEYRSSQSPMGQMKRT